MKQGKKLLSLFLAAAVAVTGINFGGAIEVDAAAKEPAVVQDVTADDGDMAALARAVSASDGLTTASYQEATLAAVNTASKAAKDVLEKGAGVATKAEVTGAINNLENAIGGVQEVTGSDGKAVVVSPTDGNKEVRDASVEAANALIKNADAYVSVEALQTAVDTANENGVQKVVVGNTVKLNGAIVALVKKTETDDSVVTPDSVTVSPGEATVEKGGSQQFTATVNYKEGYIKVSGDDGVTWKVDGQAKDATKIDATGRLVVAEDETATTLTVTATSKKDTSKKDTATVTVVDKGEVPTTPVVRKVTVTPKEVDVEQGGKQKFDAIVTGDGLEATDMTVTWDVTGGATGTKIENGELTVAENETAETLTVTATSTKDTSKKDTATVTVVEKGTLPAVTEVVVTPKEAEVEKGTAKKFEAEVKGTNLAEADKKAVTWTVTGGASEKTEIAEDGTLTVAADETAATLTVTATSKKDTSKKDTATVTVREPGTVTTPVVTGVAVTPKTATVEKGKSQKFAAAVTGENLTTEDDKAVTWTVTGTTNANTKIAADGTLTVAANETAATLTVTATSKTDNTKKDSATVTVKTPSVTVNKADLKKAIDAAAKLKKSKYTAKTWKTFNNALTAARNTYNNANATQVQVNTARTTLLNAQKKLIFKVTKVTITGSKQMAAGKKITLKATVKPAKQVTKKVKWAVDKKSKKYASVNSKGVVTAKKNAGGKTIKVTASATDDSKKKATFSIKVMKKAVSKITLKAGKKKVKAGKKITVKATVKPSKNASKLVTWSLDKTCVKKKYATISSKGVVKTTKKGKNKTITVTATATDGSKKKAKIKIKITK